MNNPIDYRSLDIPTLVQKSSQGDELATQEMMRRLDVFSNGPSEEVEQLEELQDDIDANVADAFPLIDMMAMPTMPSAWDGVDDGETWWCDNYFFTFQKQPQPAGQTMDRILGNPEREFHISYDYALFAYYRLNKNPHGPSKRPIFVATLERSAITARMHPGENVPPFIGLFFAEGRTNLGPYMGSLEKLEVRKMMFEVLRETINFEGEPGFLGTLKEAFGNRYTALN